MSDATWTLGRLLEWTTDFLRERGAESPRLDAEVLLAHARGCQRIELYTAFEDVAEDSLRERFRALVKERATGKPVAYLVGQKEFFSLAFQVTPEVLIPRPETEQLVVRALDLAKELAIKPSEVRIADVGVGSGAISVALAKHLPQARLTAIDVSRAALAIAQQNAERHQVDDQIEFVESDLFERVAPETKFELLVSNPPYVTSAELAALDVDVRKFEPHLALDGGEQGVAVIEQLVPQAADRLVVGGWLLIEIGGSTVKQTEQLVDEQPQLELHPTLKDTAGLPRVVQAQRVNRHE